MQLHLTQRCMTEAAVVAHHGEVVIKSKTCPQCIAVQGKAEGYETSVYASNLHTSAAMMTALAELSPETSDDHRAATL